MPRNANPGTTGPSAPEPVAPGGPALSPTHTSTTDMRPRRPLPIVIVGAGGIVRAAHLPAYRKAGYPVAALVDPDLRKAEALAAEFGVPVSAPSIPATLAQLDPASPRIFDVATPAKHLLSVLPQLPDGAAVLIQKPLGDTLAEAERILALCRQKRLRAAVNFQLRWSPAILAAQALHRAGRIGQLHDLTIEVSTYTPWELWSFLATAPRLEILYHSIHYIDLMRAWLGNPRSVYAKTIRNPRTPALSATKSVILLDYGDACRAFIATNHGQDIAADAQTSMIQWEGSEGLMRSQMGVNLDYPTGKPDSLVLSRKNAPPEAIAVDGSWFPDAFIGSMGSLQRFATGESGELPTSVEDAIDTMRVVEAAYLSSEAGGQPLPPRMP